MSTSGWITLGIFLAAYLTIATDKFDRSLVAMVGGTVMLAFGLVAEPQAFAHIDLNVILLLAGMMVTVAIIKRSGLFEWMALSTAKATGGHPVLLLILLPGVTAVTSAFLDNVTTVILIAPITLVIANTLKINPIPLLLAEVMASNIGATATLVGDPPHIMIGSAAGLSFMDFIVNLAPVVLVVLFFFLVTVNLTFGRKLHHVPTRRSALASLQPAKAIKDRYLLWKSVAVLVVILGLFATHHKLGMRPATVSLIGAAILLILYRLPPKKVKVATMEELFKEIDWPTLFFFIGMFIMVGGLQATGVLDTLARILIGFSRGHLLVTALVLLWGSALMTMAFSAVPFVLAIIPIVNSFAAQGMGEVEPLWWVLSLGVALGANGTFIGGAANMVVVGIANRSGHHISFAEFSKKGVPIVVLSLAISSLYVWLRYF